MNGQNLTKFCIVYIVSSIRLLCAISFTNRVMPLIISLSSDSAIAGLYSDPLTILVVLVSAPVTPLN